MAIKGLTTEQHRQVLSNLMTLGRSTSGVCIHAAGAEYTSLMSCFLMHNMAAVQSLLILYESAGADWFPVTVGYGIARSMFEVDVTAHYITQSPANRARQYILFEHVLNKRTMDACAKHRQSDDPGWREAMDFEWRHRWVFRESEVNAKFDEVRCCYEAISRRGKVQPFSNWSGKSLRQMAVDVEHEEAYDVFYAELSSFAHVDVRLVNRFLQLHSDRLSWSQRAHESDVGNVLRHAAEFLTCYLKLFGEQFGAWGVLTVESCWDVERV